MLQTEHLSLVTEVRDQFTNDLTRLSSLLQVVGEQADQLERISINVRVNDRQLRALNRRLTRAQTQTSALQTQSLFGGGVDIPTGGSNTLDDGPSAQFIRVLDQLDTTVSDVTPQKGGPSASGFGGGNQFLADIVQNTDAMSDQLEALASGGTDGGSGDSSGGGALTGVAGGAAVSDLFDRAADIERRFGVEVSDPLRSELIDPSDVLSGKAEQIDPTDVFQRILGEQFDSRAMSRAFDPTAFFEQAFRGEAAAIGDLDEALTDELGFGDDDGSPLRGGGFSNLGMRQFAALAQSGLLEDVLPENTSLLKAMGDATDDTRLRFEKLKGSMRNLRVGMTQFWDIVAAFLPLMLVMVGSMPAVIAGLVGLAGAAVAAAGTLGAIGALGLVGAATMEAGGQMPGFEDIQDVFDGLGEEAFEAFRPIAEDLAPLFEDGLRGLERFFDRLGAKAQMLTALTDEARAFGAFTEDFLVGAFENIIRFAEAAGPMFSRMASGLEDMEIMRGLAGVLGELLPQLIKLNSIILGAIPSLVMFSEGMLEVTNQLLTAGSAVIGFATSFLEALPFIQNGNRFLGKMVGVLLTLTSVVLLASKAMAIYGAVTNASNAALGFNILLNNALVGKTTLFITSMIARAKAMLGFSAAVNIATVSLVKFLAVAGTVIAGLGLIAGVAALASGWLDVGGNIDEATDSLKEFKRQQQDLGRRNAFMGDLDKQAEVFIDVTDETTINDNGSGDTYSTAKSASFIDGSTKMFPSG